MSETLTREEQLTIVCGLNSYARKTDSGKARKVARAIDAQRELHDSSDIPRRLAFDESERLELSGMLLSASAIESRDGYLKEAEELEKLADMIRP
jgi:hypothetical protein